ncbi:MAG: translocation/assembly module TamB domain-containing protein, partial [Acidobacteriota bacterium]|nr:translocation/assembly module TamB domain-containing protein [Acidobacteriota bacterium]
FDGTVTGELEHPIVAGHASAEKLQYEGHRIDSLAGDITASETSVSAANASVTYEGISGQGGATVQLRDWKVEPASVIAADVSVRNADIARILALAGSREVEVTGTLSATAHIAGTVGNPSGNAGLALAKGTIYSQPYDSITGQLVARDRDTQRLTGLFVSGPKRVNISARFAHAGTAPSDGSLDFNLTSNTLALREIALVRARQPDILGFGKFHADGSLRISHNAKGELQFDLASLNADASANSLELEGRNLGDARLTARTQNGVVQGHFESNAAQAAIRGDGTMRLEGDYPVDAKITFARAGLNALVASALREDQARALNFDGEIEAVVNVTGPMRDPERMKAAVDVSRLEVHALRGSDLAKTLPAYSLTNAGPIRAAIDRSAVRIENSQLKGPETDLTLGGTVALTGRYSMNLSIQGTVNLAIARSLSPDLTSSGAIAIDAAVRGDADAPDFTGRATIRNGEFHYADITNGLTKASGEIAFNGTRATLQSFHGESGGGKVDATGFAAYSAGVVNFRIEAKAEQVRVRYPEGVSSISDATLTLAGTSERSQVSGQVVIHRVSINPRTDASGILASTVEPIKTPAVRTGIFSNMNLDVRIATAPDVALQTSVAQSIEADANLTLRGTVTNPALLGRINITQGELNFFGNKYIINQGTISFFNATRIEPILNVDFQTRARGVDVTITVSGPIDKPNVTYRSDPPLQFSEVVALLATGRTPSDPTLAVRDTAGQSQSFQQLGASTLLGQAI